MEEEQFQMVFAACDVCTSAVFEVLELEDIVMRASLCNPDAPLITERPEWENNAEHKHEAVWLQKATAINADLHTHTAQTLSTDSISMNDNWGRYRYFNNAGGSKSSRGHSNEKQRGVPAVG